MLRISLSNRLYNDSLTSSQKEEIELRWERYCAQRQLDGRVTLANAGDHYFFITLIQELTGNREPESILEQIYNQEIRSQMVG